MIYTANNLNQYLQRTVPGSFDLLGAASTGTTVTVSVNGGDPEPVNRHNTYWHKLLRLDNTGVAAYPEVEIVGVSNPAGTNQPDIVAAETGRVFVAKTPEQFSHDADGNQLQDGRFNYSWDCENRLIGVETRQGAVPGNVPRVKVEFAYDYMSRRISKKVYARDSGSWLLTSVSSFLYDGWNLIREDTTASGTGKIVDEYIWGLDLSGSLQGAGGVGGLLCRQRRVERYYDGHGKLIICHHPPRNPDQTKTIRINENIWPLHEAHGDTLGACEGPDVTNSVFFYTYDGNVNVSELLQPTVNGLQSIAAHYEYSPFGELLVASGPEAHDNPFRFSTKYFDRETSLYYYGYRYYSPSLGRWLNRDPLWEKWDRNIYKAFRNDPQNWIDDDGLRPRPGQPPSRGNPDLPPPPSPPSGGTLPPSRFPPSSISGTGAEAAGSLVAGVAQWAGITTEAEVINEGKRRCESQAPSPAYEPPNNEGPAFVAPICKCCVIGPGSHPNL